jgi:hypothetical protein
MYFTGFCFAPYLKTIAKALINVLLAASRLEIFFLVD